MVNRKVARERNLFGAVARYMVRVPLQSSDRRRIAMNGAHVVPGTIIWEYVDERNCRRFLRSRWEGSVHFLSDHVACVEVDLPLSDGDKLTARMGQKGTIVLVPESAMPLVQVSATEWQSATLVFNPKGLKRGTMGYLLEMERSWDFASSAAAAPLDDAGLQRRPQRHRIRVGEREGWAYCGWVWYQRLHHNVREKAYATGNDLRGRDPVTGQALKGRSRGGGMRIGKQELSALMAHGSLRFLHSMLTDASDRITVYVCQEHHSICQSERQNPHIVWCPYCAHHLSTDDMARVHVPQTLLVAMESLRALGIRLPLRLQARPPAAAAQTTTPPQTTTPSPYVPMDLEQLLDSLQPPMVGPPLHLPAAAAPAPTSAAAQDDLFALLDSLE